MSDLSVDVKFCDDVRREADGRVSVMGVFEGLRILPANVHTLPKVTIFALVSAKPGFDLGGISIKVSVYRGEQLEHEEAYPALPDSAVPDARLVTVAEEMKLTFPVRAYYAGLVELQNFPVHDDCSIRVCTTRGDEVFSENGVVFVRDPKKQSDFEQSVTVQSKPSKRARKKAN
ncbi:hypothetical protein ACWWU7_03205 [Stenotrophomonas sp. SM006]|uniref:hypothetical protein n=1 Tax=Stenotrophomonas maltophilia TaxID=40324 RepID=UPI0034E22D5D